MVWPFSKKVTRDVPQKLAFKSGEAFFEYQCKFGQTKIVPKQGLVAIVLDSRKEFGVAEPVKIEFDGVQMATLKVVSDDGGFIVLSKTVKAGGEKLVPNDIVIWVPIEHQMPDTPSSNELDQRFGWVGFIIAKVKPEIDTANPNFTLYSRYE